MPGQLMSASDIAALIKQNYLMIISSGLQYNTEHTNPTAPLNTLFEIQIKLRGGEKKVIRITENPKASAPLTFYIINTQLNDQLRKLSKKLFPQEQT